jgi:hypothetical protein
MSLVSLAEQAEEFDLPVGKCLLQYMSDEGDVRVIWDPDRPDEIETARRTFDDLIGKGYQAYAVRRGGEKGERVRKFDPHLERLILAPATIGG